MGGNGKPAVHWGWRAADLLIKALIPIAVAGFAFFQHSVTSQNQTKQQETATDLKVLEMAWPLLIEPDGGKKSLGLNLVSTLRPELATKIASVVSNDIAQPDSVRQQAIQLVADAGAGTLKQYKVDIYYDSTKNNLSDIAGRIRSLLKTQSVVKEVVELPRSPQFFENVGPPFGNEVRYEPGREDDAARTLIAILNTNYPRLSFRLRAAHTPTSGTLSVFLVKGVVGRARVME